MAEQKKTPVPKKAGEAAATTTKEKVDKKPREPKLVIPKAVRESSPHEIFKWVQDNIKVGKTRLNKFAGFMYRSVEDIYTAWKDLDVPLILIITDNLANTYEHGKSFIRSTATVKTMTGDCIAESTAYAEIGSGKAGMSSEQATGSASSYARKYALNGLFLLDDSKDVDEEPPTGGGSTVSTAEKVRELQTLIRGNAARTKSATALLDGRNLLKLSETELNEIIKAVKAIK